MNVMEQFWNASLQEAKQGFVERTHDYLCLLCGEQVEKGIIYPVDGACSKRLAICATISSKSMNRCLPI